jgi:UDP-N-acetylmuramate dehydrogenase
MVTIEENASLRQRHTFATDTKARYAATIAEAADLQYLRQTPIWQDHSRLILGQGSNTLFQDNFPGLVIFNQIQGIDLINESKDHIWLKIGAGENWHQLVQYCLQHNYAGIENLSLIPGTVGAAPIQNIGAYGVELESVFEELSAIELSTGQQKIFKHKDCHFAYRYSIFKGDLANQYCITHVTLRLNKNPIYHIEYGQIRDVLKDMNVRSPSIQSISQAVITIRQSKLPDPTKLPNAGSFFKNPVIDNGLFEVLHNQYPDISHYPQANNQIKIPAAWLIEHCGWRGKRLGPVGVHENQALVIVNYDHGTGKEICELAQAIQSDIKKKFSIEIHPEVCII